MKSATFLLLIVCLFVPCCGIFEKSVPPETAECAALLEKAAKANVESRTAMFDAMATNMDEQHEAQLNLFMEAMIRKYGVETDSRKVVPEDKLRAAHEEMAKMRAQFKEDIKKEREKWLDDPNLKLEVALAEANNQYVKSVSDFARELERISGIADKALNSKKPEAPK